MDETRSKILTALEDSPVTGPTLADRLGCSRAAIWKHVEALRSSGFEISSTSDGYVVESVPEFGGDAVAYELNAPFEIEYHKTIDSTNRRARELAREGRENVVVLADRQTGGRGRLDREWISPSGGIWLSICIRPDVPAPHVPVYTLAAAVATARAVREIGVEATIKWPNDVLVGHRKLAGILTEMEGEADRVSWLVIGIGINANVDAAELPSGSTSIQTLGGSVDRRELTQAVLESFYAFHTDVDSILPAWRELSATIGQQVRITLPGGDVVGEAVEVRFPGTLAVDTGDEIVTVAAGDCEHLRPVED